MPSTLLLSLRYLSEARTPPRSSSQLWIPLAAFSSQPLANHLCPRLLQEPCFVPSDEARDKLVFDQVGCSPIGAVQPETEKHRFEYTQPVHITLAYLLLVAAPTTCFQQTLRLEVDTLTAEYADLLTTQLIPLVERRCRHLETFDFQVRVRRPPDSDDGVEQQYHDDGEGEEEEHGQKLEEQEKQQQQQQQHTPHATERHLRLVPALPSLRQVRLAGQIDVDLEATLVKVIAGTLTNLETLVLNLDESAAINSNGNCSFSPAALAAVARSCQQMRTLRISLAARFEQDVTFEMYSFLNHLTLRLRALQLEIRDLSDWDGEEPRQHATALWRYLARAECLEQLDIPALHASMFVVLFSFFDTPELPRFSVPSLTSLDLSWCATCLSDTSNAAKLLSLFPNLLHLNLLGTDPSRDTLEKLIPAKMPQLRSLNLVLVPVVSLKWMDSLVELRSLSLTGGDNADMRGDELEHLPPTIESLSLVSANIVEWHLWRRNFPVALRELNLTRARLKAKDTEFLPKMVEEASRSHNRNSNDAFSKQQPSQSCSSLFSLRVLRLGFLGVTSRKDVTTALGNIGAVLATGSVEELHIDNLPFGSGSGGDQPAAVATRSFCVSSLSKATRLRMLFLADCAISDDDVAMFVELAPCFTTTLEAFVVTSNGYGTAPDMLLTDKSGVLLREKCGQLKAAGGTGADFSKAVKDSFVALSGFLALCRT